MVSSQYETHFWPLWAVRSQLRVNPGYWVRVEVSSGCEWGWEETTGTLPYNYALSRSGELRVLENGRNGVSRTLDTTPRAKLASVLHPPVLLVSFPFCPVPHCPSVVGAHFSPQGRGSADFVSGPSQLDYVCYERVYEMGSRIRDRSQPKGSSSKKQKRKQQTLA